MPDRYCTHIAADESKLAALTVPQDEVRCTANVIITAAHGRGCRRVAHTGGAGPDTSFANRQYTFLLTQQLESQRQRFTDRVDAAERGYKEAVVPDIV